MTKFRLLFLFTLVATTLGLSQDPGAATAPSGTAQTSAVPASDTQSAPIHILAPAGGQTLSSNSVNLQFELARPALSGDPNFVVQLDEKDPVNTTSTNYTFSDLQPGVHAILVTLVDANNVPVQGGTATVQFKVTIAAQPATKDGSRGARRHAIQTIAGAAPASPIPPELRNDGDLNLPLAGSPLPLLSLIGFGLLIGGAAQAMRSR